MAETKAAAPKVNILFLNNFTLGGVAVGVAKRVAVSANFVEQLYNLLCREESAK